MGTHRNSFDSILQAAQEMVLFKFFHVFFVILWMGSLFVITHLLTYLSKEEALFQRKLSKIYHRLHAWVDLPAMCVVLGLGLFLAFTKGVDFKAGWFHMKMTFMLVLVTCDLTTFFSLRKLNLNEMPYQGKRFKVIYWITIFALLGVMASLYIVKKPL
jgi:putative membrane protein